MVVLRSAGSSAFLVEDEMKKQDGELAWFHDQREDPILIRCWSGRKAKGENEGRHLNVAPLRGCSSGIPPNGKACR
jgi:hypothetical protein